MYALRVLSRLLKLHQSLWRDAYDVKKTKNNSPLQREISPSNVRNLSPSPLRLVGKKTSNPANLLKELSIAKLKESQLQQKLNVMMQEHATLKKILFQTENNIKLKSAKIENEREKILATFKEYLNKKKIGLELPEGYDPSVREDYSNTLFKSSRNSVSRTNADTSMMNGRQVLQLNEELKEHLGKHEADLPSTLKAILRADNNDF